LRCDRSKGQGLCRKTNRDWIDRWTLISERSVSDKTWGDCDGGLMQRPLLVETEAVRRQLLIEKPSVCAAGDRV
jgi:hypothetical protein